MQKKKRQRVDGVVLLDKPQGITSNAAIQRVKRIFNAEKAGHVGTLDPMATGLLPVCLGEATKFSSDAFSADKSYEAVIRLGVTTTTGDAEGEITAHREVNVSREQLDAVLRNFTGELQQVPPMHSALKRDGKPLYAYARSGVTLEREPRRIVIYALRLLDFNDSRLTIDVSCSKGTYIRVLAEDIGAALGCGASLSGLRRTRVGSENVDQAVELERLESMQEGERAGALRPVDSLASGLPRVELDAQAESRVLMGQRPVVNMPATAVPGLVRIYGAECRFLGLAELAASGILTPRRLIASSGTPDAR